MCLLIHISQHYVQNQTDENRYFLYKMFTERKFGSKTHVNPKYNDYYLYK